MNNLIISGYTSLYELSAAFNFAYTASSQFRDVIKSGFLQDSRLLSNNIKLRLKKINTELIIYNESEFLNDKKDIIIKKLNDLHNDLQNEEKKLNNEIEQAQSTLTNKFKPLYIVSALFSFFMLFLAGEEVYSNLFPKQELIFSLIGLSIVIFYIIVDTFWKPNKNLSIIYTSTITIIILLSSILLDLSFLKENNFIEIINNKMLVNVSIIFSIFPFIFAYTRLFTNALWISVKYRFIFYKINRKANNINKKLNEFKNAHNFFNDAEMTTNRRN